MFTTVTGTCNERDAKDTATRPKSWRGIKGHACPQCGYRRTVVMAVNMAACTCWDTFEACPRCGQAGHR
jgi:16S rRNA U1498 N3-methylase RsmE